MNEITSLFSGLRDQGKTALMPFVTAGDPDLDFTVELIKTLDQSGCHLLELGFPYSDPIADGPVIQASYTRALQHGISVEQIFSRISQARDDIKMPLVCMVSYSIIFRVGVEQFIKDARQAGFAGAIIPDLPWEECEAVSSIANENGFAINPLITPMTPPERASEIARAATGFIYYVSVVGVTGEHSSFAGNLAEQIAQLRENCSAPICIGFGISQPAHVRQLAKIADGLIVGSAIVKRIAQQDPGRDQVISEVNSFAKSLLAELE